MVVVRGEMVRVQETKDLKVKTGRYDLSVVRVLYIYNLSFDRIMLSRSIFHRSIFCLVAFFSLMISSSYTQTDTDTDAQTHCSVRQMCSVDHKRYFKACRLSYYLQM